MAGVTELLIPVALVVGFVIGIEVAPDLIRSFIDIISDRL